MRNMKITIDEIIKLYRAASFWNEDTCPRFNYRMPIAGSTLSRNKNTKSPTLSKKRRRPSGDTDLRSVIDLARAITPARKTTRDRYESASYPFN